MRETAVNAGLERSHHISAQRKGSTTRLHFKAFLTLQRGQIRISAPCCPHPTMRWVSDRSWFCSSASSCGHQTPSQMLRGIQLAPRGMMQLPSSSMRWCYKMGLQGELLQGVWPRGHGDHHVTSSLPARPPGSDAKGIIRCIAAGVLGFG